MPKVREVCRTVRSKVAGPFWVTMDLMFDSQESYDRYSQSPALSAEAIGKIYNIDPAGVMHFPVPKLKVLKISYPRKTPQGGVEERDLHSGQQYTYILDVELG
ncbi:MAG: DUF4387 domain-containing protein [Emcibacter sp.]|nr:DUF4387 domain-containing protein [Emcibacter sp.]